MTSLEAGNAMAEILKELFPEAETAVFPVSDGGEGILEILKDRYSAEYASIPAHDPLMRPIVASYARSGNTAFIEMASTCGLTLLSEEERNPMETTTYGLGEMILHAIRNGCTDFIIGIGGSATNDAGTGMLEALGAVLDFSNDSRDDKGGILRPSYLEYGNIRVFGTGKNLPLISGIDTSLLDRNIAGCRFTVACDVANPFYGPEGAAAVYAPQKGASPEEAEYLDEGLEHFAGTVLSETGKDINALPGSGAAGGTGGCLHAFLGAELVSGTELLLERTGFDETVKDADIAFTGEGRSDRQTVMGKIPSGILSHAAKYNVPVILVSGKVEDRNMLLEAGFRETVQITPAGQPLEKAMEKQNAVNNMRAGLAAAVPAIKAIMASAADQAQGIRRDPL